MAQNNVSMSTDTEKWTLFMHRTTYDREFRERVKADPRTALAEFGIESKAKRIIVHEFTPDEHVLTLPPFEHFARGKPGNPYSKEPPSAPIDGARVCALTFPDDRIWWGMAKPREEA